MKTICNLSALKSLAVQSPAISIYSHPIIHNFQERQRKLNINAKVSLYLWTMNSCNLYIM